MSQQHTIIHIQPEAPPKPALGQPCNGCGVCCLLEPCPLGVLLSRRRQGACMAVRWDAAARRYRCGSLSAPAEVAQAALPRGLRVLAPLLVPLLAMGLRRAAPRWISAGSGCDSSVEVAPAPPPASRAEAALGAGTARGPGD